MPSIKDDPAYNAARSDLRNVIDIDPDARGFAAMTDADVAEDLREARVLDGPADSQAVLLAFRDNTFRTNTGTDLKLTNVFGRLCLLARSAVGDDAFGSGDLVTAEHLATALLWVELITRPDAMQLNTLTLTDAFVNNQLNDLRLGGVFGNQEKTAIQALSANRLTGDQKWSLGRTLTGDVSAARQEA